MTIIIGSIAFMALAVPFVAERSMWVSGRSQTEAQRDAQVVLRAIARKARQSTGYVIPTPTTLSLNVIDCNNDGVADDPGVMVFRSQPTGVFEWLDCDGNTITLIDGAQSQVTAFTVTGLTSNRISLAIDVLHNNRENEVLATELFLRNAPTP